MDTDKRSGIFDGFDAIISSYLGLSDNQHLKQRTTSQRLTSPSLDKESFFELIFSLYSRLEANYSGRLPSNENWRISRVTRLSDHNQSPEVLLERAIAMLSESGFMKDWYNQVPVASGLIDERLDKRAALDLVQLSDKVARFIELKWESDTPAYAAFEVLRYGLVYLFSRINAQEFGYSDKQLMRIDKIELQMVAPTAYFRNYNLGWLERYMNQAVADLACQKTSGRLVMGFQFLAIPDDFRLPFGSGSEVRSVCESAEVSEGARHVRDAFHSLYNVWSTNKEPSM